jgi:hypothetical protein
LTITDYGNNLEMRAQQVVHSLPHSLVIVGHQNSCANFHNRLCYKIVNTKTILNQLDAVLCGNVTTGRSASTQFRAQGLSLQNRYGSFPATVYPSSRVSGTCLFSQTVTFDSSPFRHSVSFSVSLKDETSLLNLQHGFSKAPVHSCSLSSSLAQMAKLSRF